MMKQAREKNGRKEGVMSLGRILVVDDEADVRKSVRLVLTKAGYDVREAEDGDQAITLIRSNDNPFKVSLIICDIHMPKVNGMEAIAFFRQEFPSVPVIVLTGKPELAGASQLFKQGIVDYLEKPVSPEKLIQVVHKSVKDNAFKSSY
jgi:two-component system, chemotaxis family, chemotaxis protein CheY